MEGVHTKITFNGRFRKFDIYDEVKIIIDKIDTSEIASGFIESLTIGERDLTPFFFTISGTIFVRAVLMPIPASQLTKIIKLIDVETIPSCSFVIVFPSKDQKI